jgi:hypothetical protein
MHKASPVVRGWSFQASFGLILRIQILVRRAPTGFSTRDSDFPFRDNPVAKNEPGAAVEPRLPRNSESTPTNNLGRRQVRFGFLLV